MKVMAYDLEATNLTADFGIILTFGSRMVEGESKVNIFNILDYRKGWDLIAAEKRMLKDISKRMMEADVWLGHYALFYDLPFINSRLLYHRLPTLPANFLQIDTWKISRNRLKLRSNRLNTISEFLQTTDHKNPIRPEQWTRALSGHKSSMAYIAEHNRLDVEVLIEVYLLLRPLILDHPSRGLIDGRGGCGVCGALKLQARGSHVTRTRRYRRFQCQSCGAWSKSTTFDKLVT